MYNEKLIKDLFEKIDTYNKAVIRICEIEDDRIDLSVEELFDTDEEYGCLCLEMENLESEIVELIIDTKSFPLVGLSKRQKGELSFFTESTFYYKKNIEKYLNIHLLVLREEMKERLEKVKPLHLTIRINHRICQLYNEAIRCYIYGAFKASCVLCRAIVEDIAKKYIEYSGYGDLLIDKKLTSSKQSIYKILDDILSVGKETLDPYSKITNRANNILHGKKENPQEKDAYRTIELLQFFIEKFPKIL